MAGQTGRASEAGIKAIRSAMKRGGWTQVLLCERLEISRSTLNQILKGQSVKLENLEEICHLFELKVEQVVLQEASSDLASLVQQLRASSADSLRKRCGTMRILDMTQPIDSGAIYTDVNILERVAGKTRREIQEMMADCGAEGFDRFFLGSVKQERVPGLEAVLDKQQLMILGRPGAGKTTFLKRLAIECLNGNFLVDRLPIFVTLKEFAETEGQPGILAFMAKSVIPPNPPSKGGNRIEVPLLKGDLGGSLITRSIHNSALTQILDSGKALVLLDGLDEVMEQDHDRIIREIKEFAERYSENHIVITCRIAAREYIFQQFTEVEMADFDDDQIQSFADKWFKTKEKNPKSTTGEMFWKELESRKPVKELAANPLLLTLLCLEFDNSSAFPQSRSELYDRALNVLLSKWDGQRRIQRGEEVYKGLSLKRKETLLGQLAMYTFERGDYFFKEKVATQQIEQYIRNLPGATEDSAALEVDSRAVLKSIESRHGLLSERAAGIYSFSHLTFQEYFTAKNILDLSNPAAQEAALGRLVEHMGEPRWKEVFLLVVEGLDNADYLLRLMKQRSDSIVAYDLKSQQFLEWVQEKSESVKATYKPAAVRAFYYALSILLSLQLAQVLEHDLKIRLNGADSNMSKEMDLLETSNPHDHDFDLDLSLILALDFKIDELGLNSFPDIDLTLQDCTNKELKNQIRSISSSVNVHESEFWWTSSSFIDKSHLREIMIKYRNIGHDWKLTNSQQAKLQEYYDANLLLANCLNSECYVSREVREELEATMLLPVAEIEKWKADRVVDRS
jgi:predicted NACHT family NTPase